MGPSGYKSLHSPLSSGRIPHQKLVTNWLQTGPKRLQTGPRVICFITKWSKTVTNWSPSHMFYHKIGHELAPHRSPSHMFCFKAGHELAPNGHHLVAKTCVLRPVIIFVLEVHSLAMLGSGPVFFFFTSKNYISLT